MFRKNLFLTAVLVLAMPLWSCAKAPYTEEKIDGHRCLVIEPADLPAQAPLVLVMHGLGGNATNLVSPFFALHLPPCRVVFPDAFFPARDLSRNDKEPSYAWYYPLFQNNRKPIETSRDYIFKLIEHYSKDPQGKSSRPVLLMGFSQGGVMSLEAGLNCDHPVLAIVSMSGYMPEPAKTMAKAKASLNTPILLVHGTQDPIIPIGMARQVKEVLTKAGYHPVLKEFPMGHQITTESLAVISDFLRSVLEKKAL